MKTRAHFVKNPGHLEFSGTDMWISCLCPPKRGVGVNYLCISSYFYSGTKCLLAAFSLFHLDFCSTPNFVFSVIFTCYWPARLCSVSRAFFVFISQTSNLVSQFIFLGAMIRSIPLVCPRQSTAQSSSWPLSDAHFSSNRLLRGRSRGLPNGEFG